MEQAAQKMENGASGTNVICGCVIKPKARRAAGLYLTLLFGYLQARHEKPHSSFPMHILAPGWVHFDTQPVDVTIQNKPNFEQINMINQLDEEDRTVVFKIIDTMLTKKKFKNFFNNNVAAL